MKNPIKFKVGDKVIVILTTNYGNNSPGILHKGYVGKITKIKNVSTEYPPYRWIDVDGHGGIISKHLKHIYTTWRERYNEL